MKAFDIEVVSPERPIHIYGDPEFAALMWQDVEDDLEVEESDEVVRLHFVKGDKFQIEWLGMELVDDLIVHYVELTQPFGLLSSEKTKIRYKGWIPNNRLSLREGTRDGLRIFKINK